MIVKSSIQKTCDPRPEKGNRRCLCVPTAEDVYRHPFIYVVYYGPQNRETSKRSNDNSLALWDRVQT